jgi:hypothetical protein
MAAMTAIMPWTAGAAGAAFESRAGRTAAAIGATATAVWTATTAAITSATLGTLETRARIAADASGIARKIFARSRGSADTRGASLAGEQDDVVFDDGWSRGDFCCVRFDHFYFGMFVFCMFCVLVFSVFVHGVFGITQSGGMFGAFVRGVGFEFGAIRGAVFFYFFGFILG